MAWVMQLIAAELPDGPMMFQDGVYLKTFDPEAHDGRGHIDATDKLDEAMKFDSFADVMKLWGTQSKTTPFRPDGKPNKPLTGMTISPLELKA